MINSRVSEEEVLNSFENLNLQNPKESPDTPKEAEKVEDLLGQPSGKFDYKVFYSKPPSYDIPFESIIPGGWGDEFEDDKLERKEAKQPQKAKEILPASQMKPMSRKETCMVEVWKNGKKDHTIGVIDI